MPTIQRSALVEQPVELMFNLVNNVAAYPKRFDWCRGAQIIETAENRVVARLDLGFGAFSTWFTTENTLTPFSRIDMKLKDGPFKSLDGVWEFQRLSETASKVSLKLDFEPQSRLLAPALILGFQTMADRMVDDFVKTAEQEALKPAAVLHES